MDCEEKKRSMSPNLVIKGQTYRSVTSMIKREKPSKARAQSNIGFSVELSTDLDLEDERGMLQPPLMYQFEQYEE
jgi:hypothetical protein